MSTLVVSRHGESFSNADHKFVKNDHSNYLTPRGLSQAVALGDRLSSAGFTPRRVMTSTIPRAVQTAYNVLSSMHSAATVTHHPELNEMILHLGEEYIHKDEWENRFGRGHWDRLFNDVKFRGSPGAETQEEVRQRVTEFAREVVTPALDDGDVLVVSHMFVLKAVWSIVTGESMVKFKPKNCRPLVVSSDRLVQSL